MTKLFGIKTKFIDIKFSVPNFVNCVEHELDHVRKLQDLSKKFISKNYR